MLLGEHAVLYGKRALVAAINKRLQIKAKRRIDDVVIISSSLGTKETTLEKLTQEAPFTFVTQAILDQKELLTSGFELEISSEMSPLFGLGTSAAVTVATTASLLFLFQGSYEPMELFQKSVQTIQTVQGRGSGADVAASVFGGIVHYQMNPCVIEPLRALFPLTVVYSGSKMATPEVLSRVEKMRVKRPALFDAFHKAIDQIVQEAKEAIISSDLQALGELCNMQQGIMDAMGVNTKELSEIVYLLRQEPHIFGSKISGSGLGDAAIGIGATPYKETLPGTLYPVLNIELSNDGVTVE
jgi:mevalonate kinase